MLNSPVLVALVLAALSSPTWVRAPSAAPAPTIHGDYLESRTADVYTGPCFANGEVNLAGKEALLAWKVTEGTFAGEDLSSLAVVAVILAQSTLGDPHASPLPTRSVLLVDERATRRQRTALLALAKDLAGELIGNVVRVRALPLDVAVEGHATGHVRAAGVAELEARCLHGGDHHCGNEETFYPPLARGVTADPAFASAQAFHGNELGTTWSWPGKRSAFVGTFAR